MTHDKQHAYTFFLDRQVAISAITNGQQQLRLPFGVSGSNQAASAHNQSIFLQLKTPTTATNTQRK